MSSNACLNAVAHSGIHSSFMMNGSASNKTPYKIRSGAFKMTQLVVAASDNAVNVL